MWAVEPTLVGPPCLAEYPGGDAHTVEQEQRWVVIDLGRVHWSFSEATPARVDVASRHNAAVGGPGLEGVAQQIRA